MSSACVYLFDWLLPVNPPYSPMNSTQLHSLLSGMADLDDDAIRTFMNLVHPHLDSWFRDWGLSEVSARQEGWRCLTLLPLICVENAHRLTEANMAGWIKEQVRNLAVLHFRLERSRAAEMPAASPAVLHDLMEQAESSPAAYGRISAMFGLPAWRIGVFHRRAWQIFWKNAESPEDGALTGVVTCLRL